MTTEIMQISLSHNPADARWGEKALISTNDQGVTIHLTSHDQLGGIQRAARKIDGQGIKQVKLAGEGWGLEQAGPFGKASVGQKVSAAWCGQSCQRMKKQSWNSV